MTNPKHTRLMMLAHEALTTEYLSERTIAGHVRRHERTVVSAYDVRAALRALAVYGQAESVGYEGTRDTYWRRVLRRADERNAGGANG